MSKSSTREKMPGTSMGNRGVSRPMAEMEAGKHSGQGQPRQSSEQNEKGSEDSDSQHAGHSMTPEMRRDMLSKHHGQTLWAYWGLVILGFWMVASPWTFDYAKAALDPSGGRDLWLGLAERVTAMRVSDLVSGLALIVFGWRSLTPNRPVSLWICCFVGVWLTTAPVLFWAPSPAIYLNATLVGMLVMALSVLIPGMPNMISFMKMGDPTPPGWSYNPSSWAQRWILIVLGFAGWVVSRYLAAYQLGYLDSVWEPFFGTGSVLVLRPT